MKCKYSLWMILPTGFLNGAALYADTVTVPLTPMPLVTTTATSTYRGRDIANNPYAAGFFGPDFSGYTDRMVTVTYQTSGGTFRGRLVARGLKPNFAYQLKLIGKPTKTFGADGDDATNERLGFTGRWWFKEINDTNDEVYRRRKDDPDFLAEGYLIFDLFITDRYGHATVDFAAAHSGHVLWRTGNPALPGSGVPQPKDTVPLYRRILAQESTGYGYAEDYPPQRISVWMEIERGTAGATVLPFGDYHGRLLLSEESFHESDPEGGFWASAVGAEEVRFRISEPTPPVLTDPAEGEVLTAPAVLQGIAEPWERVQIWEGETVVGEARTDEGGRWWMGLPGLGPGWHTLRAIALCGARTSPPRDFRVYVR